MDLLVDLCPPVATTQALQGTVGEPRVWDGLYRVGIARLVGEDNWGKYQL